MFFYPEHVREHFLNPRNVGELSDPEATGNAGSFVCGAILRFTLRVDSETQRISDAKFKATGCGYLIASASLVTELIRGMKVGEAAALNEKEISGEIGDVPPYKAHCVALCHEALHAAAVNYRQTTLEEWTGDEALICTCFGVSENSIETIIQSNGLRTVEQVTRACHAGAGCGSCQPLIQDILDDYWRTEDSRI
jgi:NifU-like protein